MLGVPLTECFGLFPLENGRDERLLTSCWQQLHIDSVAGVRQCGSQPVGKGSRRQTKNKLML